MYIPFEVENPIKEESVMTRELEPTNSPYAMAKLTTIEIGNALSQQYGHNVINLMPTNLYGPNIVLRMIVMIPVSFRMHTAKLKMSNHLKSGSRKAKREFMYVDDLSESINFIIENNVNVNLLNIGSVMKSQLKNLL